MTIPKPSRLLCIFSAIIFSITTIVTIAAPASNIAIPEPTKARYSGTLKLHVDVTDIERKIHRARLSIPVTAGALTLLFPQWLPGNHAPNGNIAGLSGLTITAGGNSLAWTRDTVNVFAFHVTVPAGVTTIEAEYQYLTAVSRAQGRVLVTPDIVNLQWNSVLLYPAGYRDDGITVEASMTYPEGWEYATALDAKKVAVGNPANKVEFAAVSLSDLIDSPVYAGRFVKRFELDPASKIPVRFNVFADNAESLESTPEQIEAHRNMVKQTYKVFGPGPYSRYEFLIAASETFGGTGGLEHRQSTEIGVGAGYFTKYKDFAPSRGVVPHELVHAWDGKFSRPADLNTRNFNEPMQNSLLWVYEGQTTYWTDIIAARSGLYSPLEAREALARTFASMERRAGRTWRNLQDTTNDPIMSARDREKSWPSWQRGSDYYPEALLIWLDADIRIRELTQEKRSLDDFARTFFAVPADSFATQSYTFDDVVNTLNAVAPYDWKSFMRTRLDGLRDNNPLDTLGRSGWKIVFTDKPNVFSEAANKNRGNSDFVHSLGLVVDKKDVISDVEWGSPAFDGRITIGATLIAVNGRAYKADLLNNAIAAANVSKKPIELLIKTDDTYRTASVNYVGGIRHPHLERIEGTKDRLGTIFTPL
ncbi:MAG: peptidase M61 [Burkholderiales bacterium]|nr:peptidase M61 [Burkholderiales bacterium]